MMLAQCTVFGNNAVSAGYYASQGGAIYNAGSIVIGESQIASNSSSGEQGNPTGGGIYNAGNAQISASTIASNSAELGGSIANVGVIQVSNSSLVNNDTNGAGDIGTAIYNTGAFLIDSNSFVTPNPTGTPPLTFDWQLNGNNIAGATSSIINLTNIQFNAAGTYSLLISNSSGLATNIDEILNQPIRSAPSFVLQPASQFTNLGATVEFQAAAIGNPLPAYQWVLNGTNIAGATNPSLTLSPVIASDAGSYWLEARNAYGIAVSSNGWLIINWPPIVEPQSQAVLPGETVTFSGSANGTGLTYQWLEYGVPLPGQTNSTLTLTDVSTNNEGAYTLVVENPGRVLRSGSAFLSVLSAPPSFVEQPQSQSISGGSAGNLWVSVAGGGASAVPPEVSSGSLQLWLRADTGAIAGSNGRVSQWQDQSVNGNHALQSDTNQQPVLAYPGVIGGMPVIRFNGVQTASEGECLYGNGAVAIPDAMTTFLMYEVNDTAMLTNWRFLWVFQAALAVENPWHPARWC